MRRALLTLLLPVLACSDPQGPCDRPHACEVEGAHVVIERFAPHSNVLDPVTRRPLVAPADLLLDVVLRNRGDTVSAPHRLDLGSPVADTTLEVPALEPGESFRRSVRLVPPPDVWLAETDTIRAWADLRDPGDPLDPVASALTPPFHLLVPALAVSVLPVRDSAQLGGPFVARVTVQNHSTRVAAPGGTLAFRFVDYDVVFPEWGQVDVPPIPPNGTWTDAFATAISADAGYRLDAWDYAADACVRPSAGEVSRICARNLAMVHVVPDLELCTGATAQIGATTVAPVRCHDSRYGDVAIWRFQAGAGQRLFFELSSPGGGGLMMFMQRDGTLLLQSKNEFRGVEFPSAGTWYLAFWSAQNALRQPLTLTITDLATSSR